MTTLSIIIPALNEAAHIAATLHSLQPLRTRGVEVVVVDGGSDDGTADIAAAHCDQVLASAKGRASQMNAGAKIAHGEVLLFLHADSLLHAGADTLILRALNSTPAWGRFDVFISGAHWMLPMIAWCMNLRSRLTGIATGDQGMFVTRELFWQVGGFPDQPLMEDIEMSARLKKITAPVCLPQVITTSGRRWEKHGVWRTIFKMWRLRLAYFCGATPAALHHQYHGR